MNLLQFDFLNSRSDSSDEGSGLPLPELPRSREDDLTYGLQRRLQAVELGAMNVRQHEVAPQPFATTMPAAVPEFIQQPVIQPQVQPQAPVLRVVRNEAHAANLEDPDNSFREGFDKSVQWDGTRPSDEKLRRDELAARREKRSARKLVEEALGLAASKPQQPEVETASTVTPIAEHPRYAVINSEVSESGPDQFTAFVDHMSNDTPPVDASRPETITAEQNELLERQRLARQVVADAFADSQRSAA